MLQNISNSSECNFVAFEPSQTLNMNIITVFSILFVGIFFFAI